MLCDGLDCTPTQGNAPEDWRHEYPCLRWIAEATDDREHPALDEIRMTAAAHGTARPHPHH